MTYRYRPQFNPTAHVYAQIQRQRALKKAETWLFPQLGLNPNMPPWTDRPRLGARWSPAEDAVLKHIATQRAGGNGGHLMDVDIAHCAWQLGRSSTSIDERLKTVLGWKLYNQWTDKQ